MNNTLHMCWIVDRWRESREKYIRAWQEAGWNIVLWHSGQIEDEEVAHLGVELRDVMPLMAKTRLADFFTYERDHRSHAACADMFRYVVLQQLGGTYVDMDIWPDVNANPETLPEGPLFGRCSCCAKGMEFEIRFIRSPAGHPLLDALVKQAHHNQQVFMAQSGYTMGWKDVIHRTGPRMAEKVVRGFAADNGLDFEVFEVAQITDDDTEENAMEGHATRIQEVVSLAKRPPWREPNRYRSRWAKIS